MSAPSKRAAAIISESFTQTVIDLTAAGVHIHCSDPSTSWLWLSDHAEDRAQAVKLCKGCPALRPCREAASARREQFGVWGAEDRTRAPGKIGRPTTHSVDDGNGIDDDDDTDTDETTAA